MPEFVWSVAGVDAMKSQRKQVRLRSKPGRPAQINKSLSIDDCVVCNRRNCKLVTHKVITLNFLKRVRAHGKSDDAQLLRVSTSPHGLTNSQERSTSPVSVPTVEANLIDAFTPFPVPGASKDTMRRFHHFFSQQGAFATDSDRGLVFDQGNYAMLYPAAMSNPALCLSVVAMASSYIAVHHQNLAEPDIDTLIIYSQTFESIRKQIEEESKDRVSESTIQAVLQMTMGSGVGFGDESASLTHWNGVLALLDKFPYLQVSGKVMFFVTQMEYWLAIKPGLKPRNPKWPIVFEHQKPLPKKYGDAFSAVFALPLMQSDINSKLLSVALTSCRATEVLEAGSKAPRDLSRASGPNPYFMHLFDVLMKQQAQLLTHLAYRNDVTECVCTTLNIYFMIVIRCTPWRAPLEHLCVRLRDALMVCRSEFDFDYTGSDSGIGSPHSASEEAATISDLYLWMLLVCSCALQLCTNQSCRNWILKEIHEVCQDGLDISAELDKQGLLDRMRKFCWSDVFLSRKVAEVFSLVNDLTH